MTYSLEEKKRINNLIAAISENIRNSKIVDILFSEKYGFLVICPENYAGDGTYFVVQSYDHLLNWFCNEVAFDFIIQEMDYDEVIANSSVILEPILNSLGEDKECCMNKLKESLKQREWIAEGLKELKEFDE